MPKFQKSDGFKMKRGANPGFKDLGSSPVKVDWGAMGQGALKIADPLGMRKTGTMGMVTRQLDGTAAAEKKFSDTLEEEGLTRNFWGKLGFGGKRSKARKARIKELEAQEQEGIDRDRIEGNTGAPVAGPGA